MLACSYVRKTKERKRKRRAKIGVDRLTKGLPPLGAILKWQLLMFKRQLAMPFSHMPDFQLVCVIIEFSQGLETLISQKCFKSSTTTNLPIVNLLNLFLLSFISV